MLFFPFYMTRPQWGGTYKGNTGALSQTTHFKEQGHRHPCLLLEFHKAVLRYCFRKLTFQMWPYIEKVKVLQVSEIPGMEKYP